MLALQCRNNDEQLAEWLRRKSNKYTGHDMQNEMLQVMALHILRKIALSIQSTKFTIMVDETTDVSTNEQVLIVLRWVDQHLDIHEDFVGLYATDSIAADSLVSIVNDVLLRMNLQLNNCRGQCYDGAANMKGSRSGLATQIMKEESRAVYTHCYGHALNLACQDTIRHVKLVRDAIDTTFEISEVFFKAEG